MPYSKAHWFVLALLPVTLLAFWPSYFGILRDELSRVGSAEAGVERIPAGARYEVIENAGYAVFVDQPEQFNRLLRGFLSDLRPN